VEAAPSSPFNMAEPDLLLELLVIALDAPAQFGETLVPSTSSNGMAATAENVICKQSTRGLSEIKTCGQIRPSGTGKQLGHSVQKKVVATIRSQTLRYKRKLRL
jgi:hypothetical protein